MKKQILFLSLSIFLFGCSKFEKSKTTGWNYNDPKHGGFTISNNYTEQLTPPGMKLVEGGSFTMGRVEQDIRYDWNNVPKTVTVSSFYMDETEVRNVDYNEYLFWIERMYGSNYDNGTYPEVYWNALPDTNVWRDKLSYNEPLVENYLRHPAYREYPVVGVNWSQAMDYCAWRTDRINERILIDNGYIWEDPDQVEDNIFNTDAYLMGQYQGRIRRMLPNLKQGTHLYDKKPGRDKDAVRTVQLKDGILFTRLRLPTEAEWEYAALGLVGNTESENISERRLYPWNGDGVRNAGKRNKGEIVANFKRGRGDQMGIASNLNDNADIPAPTRTYWPNEFGLYNLAGNVSEWVMDVYRPLIDQTTTDMNPYRGNVYQTWQRDEDRFMVDKDSLGRMVWRETSTEENMDRRNYSSSNNINFLDGDYDSQLSSDWSNDKQSSGNDKTKVSIHNTDVEMNTNKNTNNMYEFGKTSLITDNSRVYKGGSWNDRAYWMIPGTRRFLNQQQSTATIGFRCVMDRLGPPASDSKDNRRQPVDWERKEGY